MNSLSLITLSFILLVTFFIAGCSLEEWQRVGYETTQNLKEQQCQQDQLRDNEGECQSREDYDTYQKKRTAPR